MIFLMKEENQFKIFDHYKLRYTLSIYPYISFFIDPFATKKGTFILKSHSDHY